MLTLQILAVLAGGVFGWVVTDVIRKKMRKNREVRERQEYRRGYDWAKAAHAKGRPLSIVLYEGCSENKSDFFYDGVFNYCANAPVQIGAR